MRTRTVLLGDIADTCLGKMLDQRKNKGEYQSYLANVNVRWGEFDLDDLPQMRFLETEEERYGLKYGDILVCEGGEPGRCAIWKDQLPNMKFQKALHRIRVHADEVDYRWLYYRFLFAGTRNEFDQYFSGTTTIKHLPGEKLVKFRFDLPELSEQKKIGEMLSVYDDLVENNRKKIKLLEEAAQRLYKEWFIDLRFPGWETTKIVDGVPEGWEIKKMAEILGFDRGRSYTSQELTDEGVILVNLKNLKPWGGYNRGAEKKYGGAYKESQVVCAGDVIMGVTDMTHERRLVGHVAIVPPLENEAIVSMDLIILRSRDISNQFIYSLLCYGGLEKKIAQMANGTNVLHLKPEAMMPIETIVPDKKSIREYDMRIKGVFNLKERLEDEIERCSEARDRLLRHLFAGEAI